MKIFFITEGSGNIGFGHIARCKALYQACEEKGLTSKMIINGDGAIADFIQGIDHILFDWLKDKIKVFGMIKDADIVVIDSYLADFEFYRSVSDAVNTAVYIDDDKRINYPRGIVVNGSINAEDLQYPVDAGVRYLLGTKYIPLVREFWNAPAKLINREIASVMVTFGGDDIRGMTPKVLKFLTDKYPHLTKKVIIGKGFKNIREIEAIKDDKTDLVYYPDAKKMREVMNETDIAISAGGHTLYELARVGVATIAIAVADNQLFDVKEWGKVSFIEYGGNWQEKDIFDRLAMSFNRLESYASRLERLRIGHRLVDGKGASKVIDFVLGRERR